MGINRSVPSVFQFVACVHITFHRRPYRRSRHCPDGINKSISPLGSSKTARTRVPDPDQEAMHEALGGVAVPSTMEQRKHESREHAMTEVSIADDHAIFHEGLGRILSGTNDIEVVGEAIDDASTIDLVHNTPVDAIMSDLSIPGHGDIDLIA